MARLYRRQLGTGVSGEQIRWDAIVYVPPPRDPQTGHPNGKPRLLSKTFLRKGDAEKWARSQETIKESGQLPVVTKETLGEYLGRWLDLHAQQVRPVTIASYRGTLTRWILKPTNGGVAIGAFRLSKVTVHTFDALYRQMKERGIQREITYLHRVLKRALRDAVKKNILTRNPVEFATLPKPNAHGEEEAEEAVGRSMTREEANCFLRGALEERLSALWHVLLTGGLRPSEAFALKWAEVDFEMGAVSIRRTLTRAGLDRKKYPEGWALTKPKTDKSRRTVPLPEITMRELKAWRAKQNRERLLIGSEWQDHGFVFTTEFGTPLDLSNLRGGSFRRVMERAGLGTWGPEHKKPRSGPTRRRPFTPAFRLYDLRHSCASLLLMDGAALLDVSRRLGHSTIKLTADTYAHVTPERAGELAGRFDRMFATIGG